MKKVRAFLAFSGFGIALIGFGVWAIILQLMALLTALSENSPVVTIQYENMALPGLILLGVAMIVMAIDMLRYKPGGKARALFSKCSAYIFGISLVIFFAGRLFGDVYWGAHMNAKGYERCSSYQMLGRRLRRQSMWTQTREICEDPRVSALLRHYGLEGGMDAVRRHVESQH